MTSRSFGDSSSSARWTRHETNDASAAPRGPAPTTRGQAPPSAARCGRAGGRRWRSARPRRATARRGRARVGSSRPSARPRRRSPAPRPRHAAGRGAAAARCRRPTARSGGRGPRRRPGRVPRPGRGGRRPSRRPKAPARRLPSARRAGAQGCRVPAPYLVYLYEARLITDCGLRVIAAFDRTFTSSGDSAYARAEERRSTGGDRPYVEDSSQHCSPPPSER